MFPSQSKLERNYFKKFLKVWQEDKAMSRFLKVQQSFLCRNKSTIFDEFYCKQHLKKAVHSRSFLSSPKYIFGTV